MKLLALIAMIIDHFAEVFGWEGWNLIPFNANFLRYIGRISEAFIPIAIFAVISYWYFALKRKSFCIFVCRSFRCFFTDIFYENINVSLY